MRSKESIIITIRINTLFSLISILCTILEIKIFQNTVKLSINTCKFSFAFLFFFNHLFEFVLQNLIFTL